MNLLYNIVVACAVVCTKLSHVNHAEFYDRVNSAKTGKYGRRSSTCVPARDVGKLTNTSEAVV